MTIDNVVFYNKDTKEELIMWKSGYMKIGDRYTERKLYKYVIELADGKKIEMDGYTIKQGEDEIIIHPWGEVKIYE